MSVVAIVVILALLGLALIYAWRAPEVGICDHCSHLITRPSSVDRAPWVHSNTRRQKCYDNELDSPLASPDQRIDFA